eukprot:TRINITY_DN32633_c0_g1_i1.p1 TRINITY_DN32633_c0_g1~~TRINITY_DN32633_c0_g1_i1.p1  ORF type:complete len:466 (+),score=89.02 TRINITY_DN32633_c0_g1_i1:65-1462(+)
MSNHSEPSRNPWLTTTVHGMHHIRQKSMQAWQLIRDTFLHSRKNAPHQASSEESSKDKWPSLGQLQALQERGNKVTELDSLAEVDAHLSSNHNLVQCVVTQVDFSGDFRGKALTHNNFFDTIPCDGAHFWGCKFPEGVEEVDVINHGGKVLANAKHLPFLPYRALMYTVKELQETDAAIYQYSKQTHTNVLGRQMMAIHDFSVEEALTHYMDGKAVVGIMGGHGLSRHDDTYEAIVRLCRTLARSGFVIVTGGGPGAMEAANLGGYLANTPGDDEEGVLQDILSMLRTDNDKYDHEYENTASADAVLDKYGYPTTMPSIGIPTWVYGHEPTNRFASWHAKFFSNAIREDIILRLCNNGIIFSPGSAGTRQEIFQVATPNCYADEEKTFSVPMIFYSKFWHDNGLFPLFHKLACEEDKKRGKEETGHSTRMWCLDDTDEIVDKLLAYRDQRGLRKMTVDELCLECL